MLNTLAGIIASSGGAAASATSYESIATVTVGAGATASTITFSSIPSTYTHLQLRYTAKLNSSGGTSDTFNTVRFNSDSGSNYTNHYVLGDGASAVAYGIGSQTSCWFGIAPYGVSNTAYAANVIDILDYANINKYKTLRTLCGNDRNGAGDVSLVSSLWMSTSAISSFVITATSFPFDQYSSFALYGIKG